MPYIKQIDRPGFNPIIMEAIEVLSNEVTSDLVKGEYLGYCLLRLSRRFINSTSFADPCFNSHTFAEPTKKRLHEIADKAAGRLNGNNPLENAGNFNYLVSAILWGIHGEKEGLPKIGYSMRCYLRSIVAQVRDRLDTSKFSNIDGPKDHIMNSRKLSIAFGVLNDVVDEVYRRQDVPYEDGKITENGDVWVEGKLLG